MTASVGRPNGGRRRVALPRLALRGVGAFAFLVMLSVVGATTAFADCGDVAAATITGPWQLRETVTSYGTATVPSFRKPVGFEYTDDLTFLSTCPPAGACSVTIAGNATGGNFQFESTSPIGFIGPSTVKPMVQTGANLVDTYPMAGGFGGPGEPPCSPPANFLDATLDLQIASAARDAEGAWRATLITGTYSEDVGYWACQGGVGVPGAVEHVSLEGVPAGSTFPAHISATCASVTASSPAAPPVNPAESSISSALSTPADAFSSLGNSLINAAITLGIILFITFPSQVFNHTFEENYDEIRAIATRRLRWLQRLRREASQSSTTMRSALIFAIVVLVGAILGGLNDPKFGFNGRSAATYLAVILAILAGVAVSALVNYTYRRMRGRDVQWEFHALPAGLAVAAACVLVSRLSAFQPGYLYGIIAGIAFGGTLAKNEAGHSVALGSIDQSRHRRARLVCLGARTWRSRTTNRRLLHRRRIRPAGVTVHRRACGQRDRPVPTSVSARRHAHRLEPHGMGGDVRNRGLRPARGRVASAVNRCTPRQGANRHGDRPLRSLRRLSIGLRAYFTMRKRRMTNTPAAA